MDNSDLWFQAHTPFFIIFIFHTTSQTTYFCRNRLLEEFSSTKMSKGTTRKNFEGFIHDCQPTTMPSIFIIKEMPKKDCIHLCQQHQFDWKDIIFLCNILLLLFIISRLWCVLDLHLFPKATAKKIQSMHREVRIMEIQGSDCNVPLEYPCDITYCH